MENLGLGFILMVVGMITVFCILLIVIYGSRGLISLINKIAPEEQRPARAESPVAQGTDSRTTAILEAAVAQITGGKGYIMKITNID